MVESTQDPARPDSADALTPERRIFVRERCVLISLQ
jgi:hypothetical protein